MYAGRQICMQADSMYTGRQICIKAGSIRARLTTKTKLKPTSHTHTRTHIIYANICIYIHDILHLSNCRNTIYLRTKRNVSLLSSGRG